eukprot:m.272860 g.272860  ORF g.272860 m.272860 type:complete len:346 (-) comp19750_c2_seq9:1205-2242(-)
MSAAGGNGATSRPSTRQHPLGIFATPTQQTPSPATAPRGRTLRRNRPGLTVRVPDAAPAAAPEAARDGESLGKLVVNGKEYTIRDGTASDFTRYGHLGAGAFGDVYKELHVPSETVMAVKEMRDAIQPEERQRLLRDITIIREAKDSEFIVDYYGARCAQGMVMVYMELMEASLDLMYESLRDRQLRLPNHVLVYITITVLKGMLYLKQKLHVLHRDIKPSNILLGSNGEIKLCDFGMSKVMEQSVLHSQVGCERYLAPERLDPSLVGRACTWRRLPSAMPCWGLFLASSLKVNIVFLLHSSKLCTSCLAWTACMEGDLDRQSVLWTTYRFRVDLSVAAALCLCR